MGGLMISGASPTVVNAIQCYTAERSKESSKRGKRQKEGERTAKRCVDEQTIGGSCR